MTRIFTLMSVLSIFVTANLSAQKNVNAVTLKQWVAANAPVLGFSIDDVRNTRIASFYYDRSADVTMAYLQQTYKGVDIYNALTTVAFKDGRAMSVTTSRIPNADDHVKNKNARPFITAATALHYAASELGLSPKGALVPIRSSEDGQDVEFDKMGISFNNILLRLMWADTGLDKQLMLCWQVGIQTVASNDHWLVKVDALTGRILRKENVKVSCSWNAVNPKKIICHDYQDYNVFSPTGQKDLESVNSAKYKVIPYPYMDPDHAVPTLVLNPWLIFGSTEATTLKWNSDGSHDYDSSRGNNVLVQEDRNGNNGSGYGAHSTSSLPDLTFSYGTDFTKLPTDSLNLGFASTNLFYWNNILHDMEYQYGFDEAAGNFQADNLSRGGKANDYVLADVEDGSQTDNSNFLPTVDGQNPRMQMFLFHDFQDTAVCLVNQPLSFAGPKKAPEGIFSVFNALINKGPVTGNVVLYNDNLQGTTHNACVTAANASAIAGRIALIDRGSCNFTVKVKNAQKAGAIAAIVADNVVEAPIIMGGSDNTITIPAVFVTKSVGDSMKQFLSQHTTVNVTLKPGMYLDGDLDNGVITHEYFHGVSSRLTGGPDNVSCLSNREQMGEGWSDYNALMMTTDWATAKTTDGTLPKPIGNYVAGLSKDDVGIRYYPYSTDFNINPWTYDSMALSTRFSNNRTGTPPYDEHLVGEVWCEMLWDMTWQIIKTDGINKTFWDPSKPGGNSIAMKLVIEGMKLQKCSPGFVDGRDAILKADTVLYAGKYSRAIWTAFARRGLGYSADEGNNDDIKDGIAAYDLPLVLPVVWGTFSVQKVNSTALLSWTTENEQNTNRFNIERSVEGSEFTEIGTVKAIGYSAKTQSYKFTDPKPIKGLNSYRIKMVDNDGISNYSEIRSLRFDNIGNDISVVPNPARDKVVITVAGNFKPLTVKLFNNLGQQMGSYMLTGESLSINLINLAAGGYYISITGDGINRKVQLIVR